MHGDFHGAKTQIAQGALDFTHNGCFVLAFNATQRCAHGAAPSTVWSPGSRRHCLRRETNSREALIFLKRLFKNFYITKEHYLTGQGFAPGKIKRSQPRVPQQALTKGRDLLLLPNQRRMSPIQFPDRHRSAEPITLPQMTIVPEQKRRLFHLLDSFCLHLHPHALRQGDDDPHDG
ncbi:hypothetical protein D3C84_757580 [compost metagenome]